MKLKREMVTYTAVMRGGKRQVPGYTAGGLATFRVSKVWFVTHAASGTEVNYRCRPSSREGAAKVMEALLAIPVPWEKDRDDAEFRLAFYMNQGAVRTATA